MGLQFHGLQSFRKKNFLTQPSNHINILKSDTLKRKDHSKEWSKLAKHNQSSGDFLTNIHTTSKNELVCKHYIYKLNN